MFPEEMGYQELEVEGKDWNSEWSYVKIPENVQKQNYDGVVEAQADEIKNEIKSKKVTENLDDFALENIILSHSFDRIVEKPFKDRRSQVASELDRNKLVSETDLYRNNKGKNDETELLTKTPDKLQDRIGNRYSDITYKTHQNIMKNIEPSMLEKLMRYSVKKTLPRPKSRNLFEVKQKFESNMPVFPNFPQTLENNLSKVKHPSVEKSTIMKNFAPLKRSKVRPPKQRTYLENFVNNRDNEVFDFGSKLLPIKNSSSVPRPPRSSQFKNFSPRPFEIIAKKSHKPRKSMSKNL